MFFVASPNTTTRTPDAYSLGRESPSRPLRISRTLSLVTADGARAPFPTERELFSPHSDSSSSSSPLIASRGVSKRPARWLRRFAILFSVCLHATVGLAMFDWSGSDDRFGTLSDKTDAISLATEQTLVLESIETEAVQTAAAASAASQAGSVQSVEAVAQPLAETKEAVEATEPPPEPVDVAEVTPSAAIPTDDPLSVIRGDAAADDVHETKVVQTSETVEDVKPTELATKDVTEEQEKKEDLKRKQRQVTAQAAPRASMAGSTTSRASMAQSAVSGRVSASRGSVLDYAARIRAVLARHKPSGFGYTGTTRISFGLTMAGELSYAEIVSSSGKARLDQAALEAVRQAAPFGAAPSDVTPDKLRFTIPFYFR